MPGVLARHDELITGAVAAAGGVTHSPYRSTRDGTGVLGHRGGIDQQARSAAPRGVVSAPEATTTTTVASPIAEAATMFAVTNVDDILLLALSFGRAQRDRAAQRRIVLGQYLSFCGILAASVLTAFVVGPRVLLRPARHATNRPYLPVDATSDRLGSPPAATTSMLRR
jgi:hypothetical protein